MSVEPILLALQAAFLVLLYVFIWRVVRSAGRDMQVAPQESFILAPSAQPGVHPARRGPVTGRLIVVRSQDLDEGQDFELDSAQLTIGRGGQNDIAIRTDEYASARHARFEPRKDGVWVQDLGSTNGIEVNGKRVKRAKLRSGDTITLGSTEVTFSREAG